MTVTYIHAYIHPYVTYMTYINSLRSYMHTCIQYIHTDRHTCIHTYTTHIVYNYTYIHTFHTYIHAYMP